VLGVEHRSGRYEVATARGVFIARKLVIASGGLSIPKMGASDFGYRLARQFGLRVLPTRAGLVPLTLSGAPLEDWAELAGVAVPEVEAQANGRRFRAGFLFTHRGLSGPAVLQISSYWQPGDGLAIDWLPGRDAAAWLVEESRARPALALASALAELLPRRLAQRLCERWLGNRPLRQYRQAELRAIGERLKAWAFVASGTEGYRTAEVTLGGVDTDELSSATMEAKRQPDLYFIGEAVDVTGWLGGYNFQWAWASGVAAGRAV
jgi:predicted Rossmann fold flavoprotein